MMAGTNTVEVSLDEQSNPTLKVSDENLKSSIERLKIEDEGEGVLGEKNVNIPTATVENSCSFCHKPGPSKRCSKRHPKCLKKMFCNETCETAAHKKKEDPTTAAAAAAKVAAKKAAEKKKKAKSKKENNFGEIFSNFLKTKMIPNIFQVM